MTTDGDMRAALERLIQENEKLRAMLASVLPENPADIEQPTDLAEWVIVTEPLPARDDAR